MNRYVNNKNISLINKSLEDFEPMGEFLPSVYVIEITNKCNLKCIICPNSQISPLKKGYMSIEVFNRILNEISPYAEFVMLYWLGEPLLHPKICEFLNKARSEIKGKIVISSNFTIRSKSIYLSLLESCDIVICCLDRWDKEAYEKIRLGATFEKVISNIEYLLSLKNSASNAVIVVKCLDIEQNSEEYKMFQQYWNIRGAKPLLAWLNDWAGTFNGIRKKAKIPIPHILKKRLPCADLWFKMIINWEGSIQMCCFDWQYKNSIGNLFDNNWLKKVWQGEKMISIRKSYLNKTMTVPDLCKTCTTWGESYEHDAYINFKDDSYFIVF